MTSTLNPVFANRPVTIFQVMTSLATEHQAINLGQGFPDEDGPQEILEAAAREIVKGPNQYAPVMGVPALRQAVARANKRFYYLDIDWKTETLVVSGATEGLASAFLAFLNPGDEAILFAPFYDSYAPMVEAAGAKVVAISLEPPFWRIDEAVLAAAITPKTRVIAINSPHNPTGHVIGEGELGVIARAAKKHDLIVICDEVYEHLIFDGRRHVPLMTVPGMRERCIRIGSAGKTFSLTGWRVGYVTGPPRLITGVMKAHQYIAYTTLAHLQTAVAMGLDKGEDYYRQFLSVMQEKRDLMREGLLAAGFDVQPCEGTYFMTVDIRSVGFNGDDMAFCLEITEKAKVAAVPVSAFYHPASKTVARHYARFCFCKKRPVLEEAAQRLKDYFR
ncbi:MAG: aminotransferase [Parvularculaceae bacterium]